MDRFDDMALALFTDLEKVHCAPGLKEFAGLFRKCYADARREMAREVKEHYADGEETLSEFYEWLEAKAKGA